MQAAVDAPAEAVLGAVVAHAGAALGARGAASAACVSRACRAAAPARGPNDLGFRRPAFDARRPAPFARPERERASASELPTTPDSPRLKPEQSAPQSVGSGSRGVRWKGYPSKELHAAAFRVAKTP